MSKKNPLQCEFCECCSSVKVSMKTYVASDHEQKKPLKCEICEHCSSVKETVKRQDTTQFMRRTDHLKENFVTKKVLNLRLRLILKGRLEITFCK